MLRFGFISSWWELEHLSVTQVTAHLKPPQPMADRSQGRTIISCAHHQLVMQLINAFWPVPAATQSNSQEGGNKWQSCNSEKNLKVIPNHFRTGTKLNSCPSQNCWEQTRGHQHCSQQPRCDKSYTVMKFYSHKILVLSKSLQTEVASQFNKVSTTEQFNNAAAHKHLA